MNGGVSGRCELCVALVSVTMSCVRHGLYREPRGCSLCAPSTKHHLVKCAGPKPLAGSGTIAVYIGSQTLVQ